MSLIDSGLTASLRRAAKSLAEQASLHGELFWVEWEAERSRIIKVVILWLVSLLFASFAVVFLSITALAFAWDTPYRLHVGLSLALLYFVGFVVTRVFLSELKKGREGAFAATRQQMSEEAQFLKSLL